MKELLKKYNENQKYNTLKLMMVGIPFAVMLFWIVETFENRYRDKVLKGDHKIIIGKFDGISITAESSRLLSYKYVVNGKNYTRTIYDIYWYKKCKSNNSECEKSRFLVMYLVEEPDKSLICTIPVEGIEYLPDSMKLQEIPGFEYYNDTTILKCFE